MNPENDNILITIERTVNVQLMEVSIFFPPSKKLICSKQTPK